MINTLCKLETVDISNYISDADRTKLLNFLDEKKDLVQSVLDVNLDLIRMAMNNNQ